MSKKDKEEKKKAKKIKEDDNVKLEINFEETKDSEKVKVSFKKKLDEKDEEIKKAQNDMEYWKNQYYKAYADMANLRKDIEKDHKEIKKYRIEGFVEEIVRILDAFDMALKVEPKNEETKNYLIGFKYVYNQLLELLKKEGVEVIEPKVGDKFDETVMHCVETVEDEGEENIVKVISTKGYKLYDHLIRAAMVVTTKHKAVEKEALKNKEEKEKNVA